LAKEGKSRFDLSREELYDQIWKFVAKNRENYQGQFRRLGASVDWDHFTFTLDQKIVDRAYKTFKKMWDDKLIYRGERLVNFCTFHGTAFADIEVEYKTELGKMYYIHFPLVPVDGVKDSKNYILIATTRPETMLGDVAVAVHPNDKRFKHLVGRTVKIPLADREVPVIADTMVDTEFGTGAVKITAAHDPNDFDVAQKHNLPLLKVITEEGLIGHDAPHQYHNLNVTDARKRVIKELEEQKLLEKIEDHEHRVGHCYKCDTVIQPLVRDQWFVDMKPLAKKAITALKNNEITFYPTAKQDQLITYLEGLRDWNISRQIAWGIPIPTFQNVDNPDDWIFDTRVEEETLHIDGKTYRRDSDVFDTWFSSGQWPFATLDFPDGENYHNFYPLSVMETGVDILAFWVSRMIMLGLYITGKVPFKVVYLHGLVLDEHGAKMSKSKASLLAITNRLARQRLLAPVTSAISCGTLPAT
jgi:valyl-tRNA synthetase